ncbi:MAG: hypothetical protein OSB63_06040 [Planctomycetota bacterium]|nr:hypothetical protein [Planctomycetota bacterium]
MISRPTFVATLLLLPLCSTLFAQNDLEGLRKFLVDKSASRIEAAKTAWDKNGAQFIESGDRNLMAMFESLQPEIQTPLFDSLDTMLGDPTKVGQVSRVLQLLNNVLDHSSSARLLLLLDKLPTGERSKSIYTIVKYGSSATQLEAERYLDTEDARLLQSVVEASLLYADGSNVLAMSKRIDYKRFDVDELGAIFGILAEREFNGQFFIAPEAFEVSSKEFRVGLLTLLEAYPQQGTAAYFVSESIEDGLEPKSTAVSQLAILAFESGAKVFKWSRHQNKYQRFLKAEPTHRLASSVAYSLHRLGDRKGTKHLLDKPEQEYRDNNGEWPYAVNLGSMQVRLGLHSEAYRVFHSAYTQGVKNEQVRRRMKRDDFVWAARAAAGAKRPSVAFDWLNSSGLSIAELKDVGKYSEFEPYLDRDSFIALFSLDN